MIVASCLLGEDSSANPLVEKAWNKATSFGEGGIHTMHPAGLKRRAQNLVGCNQWGSLAKAH